jgi:Ala-tRNA(Pro) deacylase
MAANCLNTRDEAMAVTERLKQYLDDHKVKYIIISHSPAFTAQEVAASMHVRGKELAKTVMVKVDDKCVMAVLPAHHKINLEKFKEVTAGSDVRLATEAEFKDQFPDCETGAMPIFGNLYGVSVYVAQPLTQDEEIVFNAGSHTDAIRMKYADFVDLVKPVVADFSEVG